MQGSEVTSLLGDFRRAFELTVVDTASYVDDILVAALRYSDRLPWWSHLTWCPFATASDCATCCAGSVFHASASEWSSMGFDPYIPVSDKEIRAVFSEPASPRLRVLAGLCADCSVGDEQLPAWQSERGPMS